MKPSVHVITHFVSPYQVELFNAVAARGDVDLFVTYRHDSWKGRHWEQIDIVHPHCVLRDAATREQVRGSVASCDMVVFNLYRDPFVRRLMRARARQSTPWVFWGERPAFRLKGPLGTLYRRWRLSPLLHSTAPIWGIGSWATAKYRDEFGPRRKYADLPYYSDLSRFRPTETCVDGGRRHFLYSGALTARKGVDLIATVFRDLLAAGHDLKLTVVGAGELSGALESQFAGLEQAVHFAGFQDWQALPEWYRRANFLVAPSRYDGWGLIVAEGLAAGLPVIASDQMGAAIDLVEHDKNGWIAAAGSVDSLKSCWLKAATLTDSEYRERRQLAIESIAGHQLEDGAQRFVELCHETIRNWDSPTFR